MICAQIMKRPEFDNLGQAMDWEIRNGQVPYELPVALPEAVWRDLPDVLSELAHTIRTAKSAFSHLGEMLAQKPRKKPMRSRTGSLKPRSGFSAPISKMTGWASIRRKSR